MIEDIDTPSFTDYPSNDCEEEDVTCFQSGEKSGCTYSENTDNKEVVAEAFRIPLLKTPPSIKESVDVLTGGLRGGLTRDSFQNAFSNRLRISNEAASSRASNSDQLAFDVDVRILESFRRIG